MVAGATAWMWCDATARACSTSKPLPNAFHIAISATVIAAKPAAMTANSTVPCPLSQASPATAR